MERLDAFYIREYAPEDLEPAAHVISNTAQWLKPCDGTRNALCEYAEFYTPNSENIERIKKNFARTPIFLVACEEGEIIGIIRGLGNRISNFFVLRHRQSLGIGRALLEEFEKKCRENGETSLKVRASISSVPVYECFGFKKTTGRRNRVGLNIQPMAKLL